MTPVRSDALVLFGATGDLAYKQIFPALQALARRGAARRAGGRRRQVAAGTSTGWSSARATSMRPSAAASTRRRSRGCARGCATSTATTARRPRSRPLREALDGAKRPLHYLAIPPSAVRRPSSRRSARVGRGEGRAGRRREAVRPRPRLGARAQRDAALASSPRTRSSASTTTSARRRSRTSSYFRFANSFLEPIWNRDHVESVADHDGGGVRRAGPRPVLRGGGRDPRRRPEPPAAGRRAAGDGAAGRRPHGPDALATKVERSCRRSSPLRRRPTSCAGSSAATATRRAWRPDSHGRDVRRDAPARSTPGAGPACRSSCAPASACR